MGRGGREKRLELAQGHVGLCFGQDLEPPSFPPGPPPQASRGTGKTCSLWPRTSALMPTTLRRWQAAASSSTQSCEWCSWDRSPGSVRERPHRGLRNKVRFALHAVCLLEEKQS